MSGYIKTSEKTLANGHKIISQYNGMWGGVATKVEMDENGEPVAIWSHGILAWGTNVPVRIGDNVYKLTYGEYTAWCKDRVMPPKTVLMTQHHLDENLVCRNKECVHHTWHSRGCLVAQCSATYTTDEDVFIKCPDCILGYREKDANGKTIYD